MILNRQDSLYRYFFRCQGSEYGFDISCIRSISFIEGIVQKKISIHHDFREASKGWCFKNLGSRGWLPGAPGWIQPFFETPPLGGEL